MATKIFIFDVDGTLADRETSELLPGVRDWFAGAEQCNLAIATNQGGVGLRHWMTADGFGDPDKFPDESKVRAHVQKVIDQIGRSFDVYMCFAYQAKSGKWSPCPPGKETAPEWQQENRKPSPGMIHQAIKKAGVTPDEVLYVGNDASDQETAAQAGVAFAWADHFFKRGLYEFWYTLTGREQLWLEGIHDREQLGSVYYRHDFSSSQWQVVCQLIEKGFVKILKIEDVELLAVTENGLALINGHRGAK